MSLALQKSTKYQLRDNTRSVIIYYLVVVVIFAFGIISTLVNVARFGAEHIHMTLGNAEVITMIYLFVVGLNAFKENFGMLIQNGVSRRSVFLGRLASFGIMAAIMLVIDTAINWLLKGVAMLSPAFSATTFL